MNIETLIKTPLLAALMISFITINGVAQNNIETTKTILSQINNKYNTQKKLLKNISIQLVELEKNKNIIDNNILNEIIQYIKYITQSAENLTKNIFTTEDNDKLTTCVKQITEIQTNLKQKEKINKKQYNEVYNDFNKLIKICKNLQDIGKRSRIVLNKEKLPNDLINKLEERLKYLKNNEKFMNSEARNLVFYDMDNGSYFIDIIEELKYNINSLPLIRNKIVENNTVLFIDYFMEKGEDIDKILDDSETSIKYDFIKTEFNGYNYDTCLQEIFYLEQKIHEWFEKEYGELNKYK